MKPYHCTRCGHRVFFENIQCTHCQAALGFVPREGMVSFEVEPEGGAWKRLGDSPDEAASEMRPCGNYLTHAVCNWMVSVDDPNPLCRSCRLTRVIPALDPPGNLERWARLEQAKRRLVYALLERGLPVDAKSEGAADGLAFEFLENLPAGPRVMTGHDDGVITLNIEEADDAFREKMRRDMHEPYRTLLGHFRHESGHYYWDRLVKDSEDIEEYRTLFGDERADYGESLKAHYADPKVDWQADFVSQYATSHPWEDWAETWAHYWHIADGLETAHAWGLTLHGVSNGAAVVAAEPLPAEPESDDDLPRRVIEQWLPVSQFVNAMDRSLGTGDSYPFVLSTTVLGKLAFIDRVIRRHANGAP